MAEQKIMDPKTNPTSEVVTQDLQTLEMDQTPTQNNPYRTRSFSRYRNQGRYHRSTLS